MIECPQCNSNITGYRCGCGYVVKKLSHDGYEHRQQRDKHKDDLDHLEECRQWLLDKGIVTPGMTTSERMKALAAYRKSLDWSNWGVRIDPM